MIPHMTSDLFYGFDGKGVERRPGAGCGPCEGSVGRSDYAVEDGGLVIENGPNLFNRCLHTPGCRTLFTAGDWPAFVLWTNAEYKKTNSYYFGRPDGLGYLFVGVVRGDTGKWMYGFDTCRTVFRPGWVSYRLSDAELGCELRLVVAPHPSGCVIVDVGRAPEDPAAPLEVVLSHGCLALDGESVWADSYDIQSRAVPWDQPLEAARNRVTLHCDAAEFRDDRNEQLWVALGTTPGTGVWRRVSAVDRMKRSPLEVWESAPNTRPAAAARLVLRDSLRAVLDWGRFTDPVDTIRTRAAASGELLGEALEYFRRRVDVAAVDTPDTELNTVFRFAVTAADSMWHDPGINHGAYSWGGLTTIFRTFYGLTCIGDHDRVASALRHHALTDDRGRLRNLASSVEDRPYVSGYESYGSTSDMLWHHYRWTGDGETLRRWAPVLDALLAFEERERKDANGLFVDHLGFWASDSFSYEEGCAVGTIFVWRMYRLRALIAGELGEDSGSYERRADEIRALLVSRLWNEAEGYFHDSVDADGLPVPSPIAPACYHPVEYEFLSAEDGRRALAWLARRLTSKAGVVRVDDWHPIQWSHNVYSPLETANAAVAAFKVRERTLGNRLLSAVVVGAVHRAIVPGSISCMAGSGGETRNGTDFGDGVSLFLRATVEGLFGIDLDAAHGHITVAPNFPDQWTHARLSLVDVPTFRFEARLDGSVRSERYELVTTREVEVRFSFHCTGECLGIEVNGRPVAVERSRIGGDSFASAAGPRGTAWTVLARFDVSGNRSTQESAHTQTGECGTASEAEQPDRASPESDVAAVPAGAWQAVDLAGLWNLDFRDVHALLPGDLTWNERNADRLVSVPDHSVFRADLAAAAPGLPGIGDGVPDGLVAVIRAHENRIWRRPLTVPAGLSDSAFIPVGAPARGLLLLLAQFCTPMTYLLPQLRIRLVGDGVEHSVELSSPDGYDVITQHTSRYAPVCLGHLAAPEETGPASAAPLTRLLHADLVYLEAEPARLEGIELTALRRESGAALVAAWIRG